MATRNWVGRQRQRAQVGTLTIGTAATDGTITVTLGTSPITQAVAITPTTTNTTTTATELLTALQAASGMFDDVTWSSSAAVITYTGPATGDPVSIAKADGGSNVTTLAQTVAPLSPSDLADSANYDTKPVALDTLVIEGTDVPLLWNLDEFDGVDVDIIRRRTHTGQIGLPDHNAAGYPEYRERKLKTDGAVITIEESDADTTGSVRIEATGASAVAFTATGEGGGTAGEEIIEISGLPASSTINIAGSSVAVSPNQEDTASIVTTGLCRDGVMSFGPGATLATANYNSSDGIIRCDYTTLTMDRGGEVLVRESAGGTTTKVDDGTLDWRSDGHWGALTIGSDGVVTLARAPNTVTPSGVITLHENATLDDPAGRIAYGTEIDFPSTGIEKTNTDLGTNYTLTKTAI